MKTQMRFQKILTIATLVLAALTFVLGLSFCMGVIGESRYYTTKSNPELGVLLPGGGLGTEPNNNAIHADELYTFAQSANNIIVIMAIVLVVMVAILYVTNCNKRRNYYVTNYVAIGLYIAYAVVFTIVTLVLIGICIHYANGIDYAAWQEIVGRSQTDRNGVTTYLNRQNYSESYATMILGILDCVVILGSCGAWILNIIWKVKLMKGEKALLEQGFVKEVA